MKTQRLLTAGLTFSVGLATSAAFAQQPPPHAKFAPGEIFSPGSDHLLAAGAGKRAHTNLRILVPAGQPRKVATQTGGVTVNTTPVSGEFYETPQSLQCMYGLVAPQAPGCDPNVVTTTATTGARAIAIVDAYDNPTATSDLATFSSQFNLPAPTASNFSILYGSGTAPASSTGTGWDLEASLDIEWAHAMAPKATIFLVEAASNSFVDLFQAVAVASQAVANAGGGEVSMSYGGSEFSGETSYDSKMTTASVVYFASSGDSPGTEYPCTSPNVVCVGGTTNNRNPATGKWEGEMAWNETGGGISSVEARPYYQNAVTGIVGTHRGVPDIAAVADPATGVWVYNSTYYGTGSWIVVGGTSAATPVMAGITNSSNSFKPSSVSELVRIYSTVGSTNAGWSDVTNGACSFYAGTLAVPGWDACTGVGTPRGTRYKVVVQQ